MDKNLVKKASELPASQKMLDEVKAEFAGLRADLKTEMASLRSDIAQVLSAVHRVQTLVEEQNNNNRHVMDGHLALWKRQDRLESKVDTDIGEIKSVLKLV